MKKLLFLIFLFFGMIGNVEAVSLNTNDGERLNTGSTIQIYKNSTLPNYTSYICRKIQNTSLTDDVFIPLKTEAEFQAFLSNSPAYLLKNICEITTNCTPNPSNSTVYTATNISQTSGDGVNWSPSNVSYHSNTSTTTTCAYRCNPGYFYNGASCPSASPGYYAPGYGNTSQTACTPGNYQPNAAQTSCINATPGYYVPGGAATNQTACPAGYYQPSGGQSSCIPASTGNYVPSTGQTSQTACTNKPSNSSYTSSSGLTSNSCPWSCNANYHNEGGVCVYDYQSQIASCSAKPSNSYWNSVSSITQNRNWNGSSWNPWTPTTSTTYSASSSSSYCQYGCNSGYEYSGGGCAPASCPSTSLAGYSVGSMVHGGGTSSSRSYGISNGTVSCTQGFSCSFGSTSTSGGESCSTSCNSGYYASGGSCLPYTYTLSYGSWGSCSASPTWSSWGACSVSCGGGVQYRTCSGTTGTQTRSATCTRDQDGASVSLVNCGSVTTSQSCSSSCSGNNSQSCNTGACYTYGWSTGGWSSCSANPSWSGWSACSGGTQSRTCSGTSGTQSRTVECLRSDGVVVGDANCGGGKPSTSQSCSSSCTGISTQSCSVPVNCIGSWSDTSTCSVTCGGGQIQEVYTITTPAANGGSACSYSNGATRWRSGSSCNTGACASPVNCVGSWGALGSCSGVGRTSPPCTSSAGAIYVAGSYASRVYTVTTPAANGGAACPYPNGAVDQTPCFVCPACFIKETKVTLGDGTYKNIEDVEVGDILLGSTGKNKVLELKINPYEGLVYSINGSREFVTPGHPFMTTNGRAAFDEKLAMIINPTLDIKKLEIGDTLLTEHGQVLLENFTTKNMITEVYNFEVSGSRDYYADGFLVHNK